MKYVKGIEESMRNTPYPKNNCFGLCFFIKYLILFTLSMAFSSQISICVKQYINSLSVYCIKRSKMWHCYPRANVNSTTCCFRITDIYNLFYIWQNNKRKEKHSLDILGIKSMCYFGSNSWCYSVLRHLLIIEIV